MRIAALFLFLVSAVLHAAEQTPAATTLTPVLKTPHKKGENLIWCNTFQLCWNAMAKEVVGEPIKLKDAPPLVDALNSSIVSKDDVDAKSVYTKTGKISQALLDQINTDLKAQFGQPDVLKTDPGLDGYLAYAFLYKKLAFATPFETFPHARDWADKEAPIQVFGVHYDQHEKNQARAQQVLILVDEPGRYVVELKSSSRGDRLILAQTPSSLTLEDTLALTKAVIARQQRAPFPLQFSDTLEVPHIQMDLDHSFKELVDLSFLNTSMANSKIVVARQTVRFDLNEKGVELKSTAELGAAKNGHPPRKIIFNDTFLLLMQKAGAERPYFVAWFENPNLFLKSDKPAKKTHKLEYKK